MPKPIPTTTGGDELRSADSCILRWVHEPPADQACSYRVEMWGKVPTLQDRELSNGHQVTVPPDELAKAGIGPGQTFCWRVVAVTADGETPSETVTVKIV